jgi:hypothetical protein
MFILKAIFADCNTLFETEVSSHSYTLKWHSYKPESCLTKRTKHSEAILGSLSCNKYMQATQYVRLKIRV